MYKHGVKLGWQRVALGYIRFANGCKGSHLPHCNTLVWGMGMWGEVRVTKGNVRVNIGLGLGLG